MADIFDPNNELPDTAAASLRKDLGQQAQLQGHIAELQQQLERLPEDADSAQRGALLLELGRSLQTLERGAEAWPMAHTAFGLFMAIGDLQNAADACDVMYQCEQPDSLVALGHGTWLAVSFPMDPEITVHLLSHIVDDTPDDADGAAVAAATASFIADLRAPQGPDRERLVFFAQQLLGRVARRHSDVETQQQFDDWVEKLELNDPDKFLIRLRNVLDVLVQDQWWFDRDALRAGMPEH